jgi:multidrug efflux pump subunit AcrA (membrane-fusion protein)
MKQHSKISFAALVLLLTLLLSLSACDAMPWATATAEPTAVPVVKEEGVVSAEGRLVPVHTAELGFLSGGELGELLVSEGDNVAAGDTLARLGKTESLQASLSQASLELLAAQQALDSLSDTEALERQNSRLALAAARIAHNQARIDLLELDTQDFQDELDDLEIAVQDAKTELDDAKDELAKYQDLDPDNSNRKNAQEAVDDAQRTYDRAVYDRDAKENELEQAKSLVDQTAASLAEAHRQFDNRLDGIDADTLALAEARLASAEAMLTAAQRGLENSALTAPLSATVVSVADLLPGEIVNPGAVVVKLADLSGWLAETRDLTELDVVDVEIGQDVTVTPDALPDLQLSGTVESIDQVYTERSGDVLYTVTVRLNESDPRLRWGMTVNMVFQP